MRRVADDDLRLFGVEQFKQAVLLVGQMNLMVLVTFVALANIEGKGLRFFWIASDTDDFFRIGMGEQIHGCVHPK